MFYLLKADDKSKTLDFSQAAAFVLRAVSKHSPQLAQAGQFRAAELCHCAVSSSSRMGLMGDFSKLRSFLWVPCVTGSIRSSGCVLQC